MLMSGSSPAAHTAAPAAVVALAADVRLSLALRAHDTAMSLQLLALADEVIE
jgi:hypothetical protein